MSVENQGVDPSSSSSMSSLVGAGDERWSLSRAIDALGDAARQAGAPGWIWLAGLVYPTLSLGFANLIEFGLQLDQPRSHVKVRFLGQSFPEHEFWLAVAPTLLLLPIVMRFVSGLARVATPQAWNSLTGTRRTPRLRDAWKAGRGHAFASLGLWLQLVLMVVGAGVVLIIPPYFFLRGTGLAEDSLPFLMLLGPFAGVWMIYGLMLSVIYQLALHSLIQNHRGITSALIHAWRLARNDPWVTARTVLVDFLLYVTILFLTFAVSAVLAATCVGIPLAILTWILLPGFAGVTRAAYWAHAYRALGGLSPDDHVPGLAAAPSRESSASA